MANQDELFDFNEEQKQLQKLIDQFKVLDTTIMKVSADALTAGRNINAITLPSDLANFTAQNAQLTATIQAQARELARLQAQYNSLSTQRQRSSTQTAEEAVNQRILNRNARESATINSTLAGAYQRLVTQQTQAARAVQNLIAAGRQATQTQREFDRELRVAQREFDRLNARVVQADRAVGRFQRNVGNYSNSIIKSVKEILAAFGLVAGAQMIAGIAKDIFETTKEIQSMDMALKQVTGTQEIYAQSQMFLSRIAEAYGSDLGKLTTQFTQFYVSAKDKLSGSQIEDIFESITKAGATMGLSTEKQERAFLALNQMMSKGTIQAEELKGQLGEALPGALGIMAKALGVTEIELAKMMKNGELLASDVLPKFARQLEITYGIENVNRVETLAAAQTRYTNAWRDFVRGLDEDGNKLSNFMKKAIGVGTDLLIGVSRLLESSGMERNRIIKTLQEQGYNETIAYYKKIESADEAAAAKIDKSKFTKAQILEEDKRQESIKQSRKKDLENDRAYNLAKAKEETEEFNRLKKRQLILKAITPEEATFEVQMNDKLYRRHVEGKAEMLENSKRLNDINNLLSKRNGQIKAVNKLLDEGKNITAEDAKLTKAQLKEIEDALKAKYDAAKKELELKALNQEVILNADLTSYKDQEQALEKWLDLRMQIIKLDHDEQVRLAKGNKDKIRIAEIDAEMATIKNMQDGYTKQKNIRKKQNDEYIQEIKDIEDFLKQYHEDQDLRQDASDEVFLKGWKSREEAYDKQLERLKELKAATKDYLSSFSDEFASDAGFGETFNVFFKQIEALDKNGNKVMTTMFKQLWEGADTSAKKFAVAFNAIGQTVQETFNFISSAGERNFDAEKERLQSQYDVAIKYAGDNKAAQEKLSEDLEKSQKDIDYRKAKADKKNALFNIAINTAQAVVSAVAESPLTFGLPWSAFALALGAAQAAVVSAQDIPRYFKGGTHDGGLMMVNDAPGSNFKETIVFPNGGIAQPEGRDVLMNAPRGTKIYTPDQWEKQQQEEQVRSMLHPRGILMHSERNNGFNYEAMDSIMNKYLGNVTVEKTVIDKDGFSNYVEKQGSRTKINRAFASSKGFKFK